ncbi:MAG: triphosphoribosyl-dephospho-CoA synthase [Candidatus Bathyarchaeia archaeon]
MASALQLAMLLEVSGYPKPGNVHRTGDFKGTRFEHFLASASALHPVWRMGAQRGLNLSMGARRLVYGDLILKGCREMMGWQRGGNTSLGVILLLTPMSLAAGLSARLSQLTAPTLRENISKVLDLGTYHDTLYIYRAIREVSPGGIGGASELDVMSEDSLEEISRRRLTPLDVFRISASRDSISREWVTGYSITFTTGYPTFMEELECCGDVNVAVVDTFLRILAEHPDTLIARKVGFKAALKISRMAGRILREGGLKTIKGSRMTRRFDNTLRRKGNLFNPGATADLTCSSIGVAVLTGFKP